MERGSDTHGPRLDDALAAETAPLTHGYPSEARADESREQEGPADDEPVPDSRIAGDRGLPGNPLGDDAVNERSELARHLRPSAFPAGRDRLLAVAEEEAAPEPLLARLRGLPGDVTFDNLQTVWEAMGGRSEHRA